MPPDNVNRFQVFPAFVPDSESWKSWTSRLASHLILQKCVDETEKTCAIVAYMGPVAYKKLYSKVYPEREPNELKYEEIVKILGKIFEPEENLFSSRIAFRKLSQAHGETLADFEARLRKACTDCAWKRDELPFNLMEQFIAGLSDKQIKQAVLVKSSTFKKFEDLFDFATNVEMARRATKSETELPTTCSDVNFVKHQPQKPAFLQKHASKKTLCYRCGDQSHLAPSCPFIAVKCGGCGKVGHLQKVCRSKPQHFLEEIPFHYIDGDDPLKITVHIGNHPVNLEIDSGSRISTMPLSEFRKIFPKHQLYETDVCLRTATGEVFKPHSYAIVEVLHEDMKAHLRLYLVNQDNFPTLFGRKWLRELPVDFNKLICKDVNQIQTSDSTTAFKMLAKEAIKEHAIFQKDKTTCIPKMEAKFELVRKDPPSTKALPPLSATRMQHDSIDLMNLNFDIVYRSTHDRGNAVADADARSRLPLKGEDLPEVTAVEVYMNQQKQELPLKVEDIARETEKFQELKSLLKSWKGSHRIFTGDNYILLPNDAHSKWLEAIVTNDKTAGTTLKHLREMIARYGIPSVMVTGKDPTFVSQPMNKFCAVNVIVHETSPANRSTTTKAALKKLSTEGGEIQESLTRSMHRQHIVVSETGSSPAAIMLGRELRSRFDLLRELPRAKITASCTDDNSKYQSGEIAMVRDFRNRSQVGSSEESRNSLVQRCASSMWDMESGDVISTK